MNELIEFWDKIKFEQKPHIHPEDKNLTPDLCHSYKGLSDYYENKHWDNGGIFHTDLLPVPYVGDLKNAKIFLLFLNPGFSLKDYYSEESSKDFVNALKSNIRQDFGNSKYPFHYLDPNLMWTGGSQYWLKKLKDYIPQIKEEKNCTYIEATQYLSQRIAVLELMPYHSANFTRHSLLDKLESVKKMQQFVKNYVIPKVRENKAGIICTRKAEKWGLQEQEDENIIVYRDPETRGAHISKKSRASRIFDKFLVD